MTPCIACGIEEEAKPGCRLCLNCLAIAAQVLRGIQAEVVEPDEYISATHLRQWGVQASKEEQGHSPLVVLLRGLVQGVIMSADLIQESGADPSHFGNWGRLVHLEAAAMQALSEARR